MNKMEREIPFHLKNVRVALDRIDISQYVLASGASTMRKVHGTPDCPHEKEVNPTVMESTTQKRPKESIGNPVSKRHKKERAQDNDSDKFELKPSLDRQTRSRIQKK